MRGERIRLSRPRRFVCDLLHFAAAVPTVPVQRRMALGELAAARAALAERPPWAAIFVKAYAKVADAVPALRRAYVKFPWPHLYQYPHSVASIAVERPYRGEPAVFIGKVKDPARLPLAELARRVRGLADVPLAKSKDFRRALCLSALPRPLRRLIWWVGLNVGRQRANYFGTFGLSVYSALGAEALHPLSPVTTLLNYGVIAPDGSVDVRVVYDHRVTDGATVARALAELESVLRQDLLAELRQMAAAVPRAA